jgi:hypothetical protein
LLTEHWLGSQGGTGQSYNFYDVTTKNWRQVWVSPGVIIDTVGGWEDGAMRMEGEISYQSNATRAPFRARWTPQPDASVLQEFHQLNAETDEWDTWFIGI